MKINITIEDDEGEIIVEKTSERTIPFVEEFDSQGFRKSFGQIETAVLEARKEISDGAVTEYIDIISKKKIEAEIINYPHGEAGRGLKPCIIESELGSLRIATYEIMDFRAGKRLFTVTENYFGQENPNQKIITARFEELAMSWIVSTPSYRNVSEALNRIRLEVEQGVKPTWLRDNIEKQGKKISEALHEQADFVLEANGFNKDGHLQEGAVIEPAIIIEEDAAEEKAKALEAAVKAAAAKLEIQGEVNAADYDEAKETTVNISPDDVLTDRQAAHRPNSPEKGQRKYVTNTVIHVENNDNQYYICDACIKGAFILLLGFLASNGLIGMPLYVFFTDGASDLRGPIENLFAPFRYKMILDWHHLMEKVEQRLSSGMKNYKMRHIFEDEVIKPLLWYGNVKAAITSLKSISQEDIRSEDSITSLINYLIRNEKYIPCYALRHELGLRNSSNRVEKANDIIVSMRQKNQGMSWSYEGSRGLASVTAAWKNGEVRHWSTDRTLPFTFPEEAA